MKVHCVYIPDVIVTISLMWLLFEQHRKNALCLYSGCHYVYMPDVTSAAQKAMKVIVSIFRMQFCIYAANHSCLETWENALCANSGCYFVYMPDFIFITKTILKVHCVYIPDVILCICRCYLCIHNIVKVHCDYSPDVILCIYRMPFLLKTNTESVYIPDHILFICRMTRFPHTNRNARALCLYSGCYSCYMHDVISASTNPWKCIVFIFQMQFCLYTGWYLTFEMAMEMHWIYFPEWIMSICRMSLLH